MERRPLRQAHRLVTLCCSRQTEIVHRMTRRSDEFGIRSTRDFPTDSSNKVRRAGNKQVVKASAKDCPADSFGNKHETEEGDVFTVELQESTPRRGNLKARNLRVNLFRRHGVETIVAEASNDRSVSGRLGMSTESAVILARSYRPRFGGEEWNTEVRGRIQDRSCEIKYAIRFLVVRQGFNFSMHAAPLFCHRRDPANVESPSVK